MDGLSDEQKKKLGINFDNLKSRYLIRNAKQLKYFISFDPQPYLKKVKIPVLAINGSKDVQVLADINLKAINDSLEKGGNKHYEINKLDGLNHLFQTANTGLPDEYSHITETISPIALNIISDWILKNI